jgi:hypothetical protein
MIAACKNYLLSLVRAYHKRLFSQGKCRRTSFNPVCSSRKLGYGDSHLDRRRNESPMSATELENIAVVLVAPQMPEDIRGAAWAMDNGAFRRRDHLNHHTNYHKPYDLK